MPNSNKIVKDFGDEWERFNYLDEERIRSLESQFQKYIAPLPRGLLQRNKLVIADFGAGSGRWAHFLEPYASRIYVIEPSEKAFKVASSRFANQKKVVLLNESVEFNQVPLGSLDLAVSLGVLHHIHDTEGAIKQVSEKIKVGGHFLCYLYYSLENKSKSYKYLWKTSDYLRAFLSKLPRIPKQIISDIIALLVYLPLARISRLVTLFGFSSSNIPLHHYEKMSYHVMRNDALDRFGTKLENRFSKAQISEMLFKAGFDVSSIAFSDQEPFWTFCARKEG